MARADSTVRVNIIGDARSLQDASRDSGKAIGGIGKAAKVAGGAIAAAFAVDAVLDFAQTALGEADRIGDATTRLEAQLGDLSGPLVEAAGNMEHLGQSRQDVLELEARFTDLAKAAHLSNAEIAASAAPAVEAASALALLGIGGGDTATVLDLIGKAAGGSSKPLKELGVDISETDVVARALAMTGKDNAKSLTDQELAAARLSLIMEQLAPRITAVTEGSADLEQRQSGVQARWETLTGKIGEGLEGPLNDFLEWVLQGIDGLGMLDQFVELLDHNLREALGPIARVTDAVRGMLEVIGDALEGLGKLLAVDNSAFTGTGHGPGRNAPPGGVTVQVQGGSPEVVEQAVIQAIQHAQGTGSLP